MRKAALALTAIAILTGFIACKHTVRDSGCITRYSGPDIPTLRLQPGQLDTIRQFFAANNLPLDGKNFIDYYHNIQTSASGQPETTQVASAQLYFNGLPVFYSIFSWAFRDGIYMPGYGTRPQYAPGTDTTPHLTLPALREIFFKVYEDSLYAGKWSPHGPTKGRLGSYYHDTCLTAQLGYFDTYYEPPYNNKDFGKNIVLVWRISPGGPVTQSNRYGIPPPVVIVEEHTGYAFCYTVTYPGQPIPRVDPLWIDFPLTFTP